MKVFFKIMYYPTEFTTLDIMEFEYYYHLCEIYDPFCEINRELQFVVEKQQLS